MTSVNCTSCGYPVPVILLTYQLPSAEFLNGSYLGRCKKCGAVFEYEADYIKKMNR